MTDEEKPIATVEAAQSAEPPRPPSKWTSRRIFAAAVTIATLLGGIWTLIQLSEWIFLRPEKLEAGWRRVQLNGGASIAMPQSWDVVEKQALLAQGHFYGFDPKLLDFMTAGIGTEPALTFIAQTERPWPAPFAMVIPMRKVKWNKEAMIDSFRRGGFKVEGDMLNGRPAIHAIGITNIPSNPPIQLLRDLYLIDQPDMPWVVCFLVDSLDFSGMI